MQIESESRFTTKARSEKGCNCFVPNMQIESESKFTIKARLGKIATGLYPTCKWNQKVDTQQDQDREKLQLVCAQYEMESES